MRTFGDVHDAHQLGAEFVAWEHHSTVAPKTLESYVRADSRDLPLEAAARMRLAQYYVIAGPYRLLV